MSNALATPDNANVPAEEPSLTQDEIFHLLQCRRRRDALRYLRENEGPVRMRDLAEQVAAWEHDTTVRELRSAQRQRVYIPLYQTHLPKLDKAGLIEYQQSRGIVERTDVADVLDPYLRDVTTGSRSTHDSDPVGAGGESDGSDSAGTGGESDDELLEVDTDEAIGETEATDEPDDSSHDWTRYYIGASGLGFALVGGSVAGLPAISTLSGTAVGTIVSGVFAALTTAQTLDVRFARNVR